MPTVSLCGEQTDRLADRQVKDSHTLTTRSSLSAADKHDKWFITASELHN